MKEIFISHAVADKQLVDAFVDFLITGCGVGHDHIFCSSLEGMTIPEGVSFADYIKSEVQKAKLVIMVITPSYYESVFCICELGATWALGHDNFPLLVPPLGWTDMKAVLQPRHGAKIDDPNDLANLLDRIKNLKLTTIGTARFEVKKDAFINKLKTLTIAGRTSVTAIEHEALKMKYDAAIAQFSEYDNQIAMLKKQFQELAEKKDPEDVRNVILANSDETEQFESLVKDFKSTADSLPSVALEAMFSEEHSRNYTLPDFYGNEDLHQRAQLAAEREIVKQDGHAISLNNDHPEVYEALSALHCLKNFMTNATPVFIEQYESDWRHPFSIKNRDFWEEHLGL